MKQDQNFPFISHTYTWQGKYFNTPCMIHINFQSFCASSPGTKRNKEPRTTEAFGHQSLYMHHRWRLKKHLSAKELNHAEYKHVYTGTVYGHRTLITHFLNDMMAKEKNSQAEKCREKSQFPYLLSDPFPPPQKKKKEKKGRVERLKVSPLIYLQPHFGLYMYLYSILLTF